MMKNASLSQLSLIERITVFFFFVTVFFRLFCFPSGSTRGGKAGDTGNIYAVLSVSALFAQICYGFIQDKLGLRKNLLWFLTSLLILSGPAFLLFGYLLQINVLLGSIFRRDLYRLTFNGG